MHHVLALHIAPTAVNCIAGLSVLMPEKKSSNKSIRTYNIIKKMKKICFAVLVLLGENAVPARQQKAASIFKGSSSYCKHSWELSSQPACSSSCRGKQHPHMSELSLLHVAVDKPSATPVHLHTLCFAL